MKVSASSIFSDNAKETITHNLKKKVRVVPFKAIMNLTVLIPSLMSVLALIALYKTILIGRTHFDANKVKK
ncbi:hypothetical protein [Sulfurovum sp.]|uniref:hypothetical protein n=1 Tax=Sulfurovum sp. TaxID=1969726 RepID=UPI00356B5628